MEANRAGIYVSCLRYWWCALHPKSVKQYALNKCLEIYEFTDIADD